VNISGTGFLYDVLRIIVPVNVSMTGFYRVYAGLFDPVNDTLIVKTFSDINCSLENVTLEFNGTKIYKKQYNGTFEFRAKIINSTSNTEYDNIMATTSHYNYTDFVPYQPEGFFGEGFSSYINSNGDLVINVTVNVSQTGTGKEFEIYGELFQNQTMTYLTHNITTDNLSYGNTTMGLVFNGSAIKNSTINGPYILVYLRLSVYTNNQWEEIDVIKDAHITQAYHYTDFGGV
jgi:hypothetical protein